MTPAKQLKPITIRVSQSLLWQMQELASYEHISVNHLISIALAESLSRLERQAWDEEYGTPGKPGTEP